MIPATSIHFNDDGTAWWVPTDDEFGDLVLIATIRDEDRPCDTCDGRKWCLGDDTPGLYDAMACPDCDGTGRHTFTIEVENPDLAPIYLGHSMTDEHCVSVVPGMVEEREDGTWRVQLKIH